MNYLAHLFVAPNDPESRLGNACADFVKGAVPTTYPLRVQAGIRLHRSIDAFTDNHPVLRSCAQLFEPEYRRYAGVMLDVTFDHLLARSWTDFATLPLSEFVSDVYRDLIATASLAPTKFLPVIESMTEWDWLSSYMEPQSVERMLHSIAARLRRPNPLRDAAKAVFAVETELESAFRTFLPQLAIFATQQDPLASPFFTQSSK
jgi:acyl carrier protein phosphodiesterase